MPIEPSCDSMQPVKVNATLLFQLQHLGSGWNRALAISAIGARRGSRGLFGLISVMATSREEQRCNGQRQKDFHGRNPYERPMSGVVSPGTMQALQPIQ